MKLITHGLALLCVSHAVVAAPKADRSDNEAAPYCLCFDEQENAGSQAGRVTKYLCRQIYKGRYKNGFGPEGNGASSACVNSAWSEATLAQFAGEWKQQCQKYAGPAYIGGCYWRDGSRLCLGDGKCEKLKPGR